MGKRVLLFLWVSLLCLFAKAADIDSLHPILYKAFLADTEEKAKILFAKSKKWVVDDSSRAYYHYFKYYYFHKNQVKDSIARYHAIATDQLYTTKQYPEFFNLRNNLFWDLVDESLYDEAVVEIQKNIQYAQELKDTLREIDFYAHWAVVYHDIAEYAKGIATAKIGLRVSTDPRFNSSAAHCYNAIGICYDDGGQYDSAIHYHTINLSIQDRESEYYAQTLNNLGNTFSKMNEVDSAKKYISMAIDLDKIIGRTYSLATSLNNMGGLFMKQTDYKQAKFYLDSALHYTLLSNSNEKKRDVYNNLYQYNQAIGNYKEALDYLGKYHTFKDSMLNNERVRIINNLEFKATEAKLSEQISKAKASTALRNFWIVLVSGGLLIALLVARQLYIKRKRAAEESKLKLQNERLRISRDLHDNLGAELTYISSVIDQKAYAIKDPQKKAELEHISNSSRHAMDQMRETIWAIKTDEILVSKFANKIKNTSAKYAKVAHMELDVRTSGEDALMPPSKVIVLFRVCQEAINNAVKYAHGQKIILDINVENNHYIINITDDGVGFNADKVKKGYGLNNMTERMDEIRGTFTIHSEIEKGTTITLKGPLIT